MGKWKTFKKLWMNDKYRIKSSVYNNIVHTGITNLLPDELYLKLTYRVRVGQRLNLDNPTLFCEKIQWLKLHDHQERYIKLVDKVLAKEYVASIIGDQYIIPTIGVWDRFEDINFEALPEKFVLKCNHDSGSVIICRDKASFDIEKARKKLNKRLQYDMYHWGREWPYKGVRRKILAETFLENNEAEEQPDSYVFDFDSFNDNSIRVRERVSNKGKKITFVDTDWKKIPYERYCLLDKVTSEKPFTDDELIEFSDSLSCILPLSEIVFLKVRGHSIYGEIVLKNGFQIEEFTPSEQDKEFGKWIRLPSRGILFIKGNIVLHISTPKSQDLTDYKFFCFNGEPRYCQIITDRTTNEKIDFYDMDWIHQPFVGLTPSVKNSGFEYTKPVGFDDMKRFAKQLCTGTALSRIDFYEVNSKLYFGEITLYPASGFGSFFPTKWNKIMGDLITLPR